MKVKTSELEGIALDYAVKMADAKKEGWIDRFNENFRPDYGGWSPSSNWAQGGPIIEREDIHLVKGMFDEWLASAEVIWLPDHDDWIGGGAPLIAAMRAYVNSKLCNEVEIPEELMK